MKKTVLAGIVTAALISNLGYAAKLCGKISWQQAWDGGVFSVIDSSGMTVASTQLVYTGAMGCTDTFDDGMYIVRFNGFLEKKTAIFDDVTGCLTQPYQIEGATPSIVVFDNGRPPFNAGGLCAPATK